MDSHARSGGAVESKVDLPAEEPQDTGPEPVPSQIVDLLNGMLEQIEDVSAARDQNLGELHEMVVELSMVIASHVVKRELDAGQLNLSELANEAIQQLLPAEDISVRTHPDDVLDLESLNTPQVEALRNKIDIVKDASLQRGTCMVSNGESGLFSTLENRLENIRDTLLQGIEYARFERRKTVRSSESLRRFPDRRKLA